MKEVDDLNVLTFKLYEIKFQLHIDVSVIFNVTIFDGCPITKFRNACDHMTKH